jgi:hypothetical protein
MSGKSVIFAETEVLIAKTYLNKTITLVFYRLFKNLCKYLGHFCS